MGTHGITEQWQSYASNQACYVERYVNQGVETGVHLQPRATVEYFNITELTDVVIANLSTADMISFQLMCRGGRKAVAAFKAVAFNPTRLLSVFFQQPDSFRVMQARTGSVIGGTAALSFFTRTTHEENDMELYVNPGHGYEVARHLIDSQGYDFWPFGSDTPKEFVHGSKEGDSDRVEAQHHQESVYAIRAIDNIFRFVKGTETTRQIFMIMTTRCTLHTILNSHSTASMNIISHDMAVSLYPRATFLLLENQELFWNMLHGRDEAEHAMNEIAEKGIIKVSWRNRKEARSYFMTGESRRVGDKNCWTIPFTSISTSSAEFVTETSPSITRNLLFENTWKLVGAGSFMQMKFCVVSLPIFRYSYTVSEDSDAAAMRDFYEDQWPMEKAAKVKSALHQTWQVHLIERRELRPALTSHRWDGKISDIQEGSADNVDYSTTTIKAAEEEVSSCDEFAVVETHADWEQTESTISERSYFDVHPVLINSRMKSKTIKEILNHYRRTHKNLGE
ncbi:hypothetical protein HWV62_8815 [Athelia sp. TMB]|nr:hypothetical protein HWV62_8815 [Athelia sp. TMB]